MTFPGIPTPGHPADAGLTGQPLQWSDFSDTWVALDLETTGLDPERDEVVEIAAVKFQGDSVVESLTTLVNPFRPLPEEIRRRTGLTDAQLLEAPPFAQAAERLGALIAGHSLVGHNVDFFLAFLSARGMRPGAMAFDTIDLASFLLPRASDYTLPSVARTLNLPAPKDGRADPITVQRVFLALLERLERLDPGVLGSLTHIAARSGWRLHPLLRRVEMRRNESGVPRLTRAGVGLLGVDTEALSRRVGRVRSLVARVAPPLDPEGLARLLEPGGPLAQVLPRYEHRPQQAQMLRSVAQGLGQGHHLVVEGGTGIGKTVAYLVPAIVFAATTGQRVVISTNTINLQEQLVQRDIPALVSALEEVGAIPRGEFKAVQLKGRGNYLCLQRWAQMARGEAVGPAEARLLGRTLIWLQDTATGDKGELRLPGRDAAVWGRLAADQGRCMIGDQQGFCFVRAAREQADGAHIVVVNHALLLTSLANGGNVIPKYDRLVIDEAHHLEEGATHQFGYDVAQGRLEALTDALNRTLEPVRIVFRGQLMRPERRKDGEEALKGLDGHLPILREAWARMWGLVAGFVLESASGGSQGGSREQQVRLTVAGRSGTAWTKVELAWEDVDLALKETARLVERLPKALRSLAGESVEDFDLLAGETEVWLDELEEVRAHLLEAVNAPEPTNVYWLAQSDRGDTLTLAAAPLHVGPILHERLFGTTESVVLTSATLATGGSFKHLRDRVGLEVAEELLVGSPFDYKKAALLLAPLDIPDPDRPGYGQALLHAVTTMATELGGHTMVLFTSYASLQSASRALRASLPGMRVLAQGVDGSPQQLVEMFQANPKSVLLGTASFWEGVDLAAGVLRCLVLAKLPFTVPTEPVFAARSEQYEQPFGEYAVPQAVLRFRQGFGRLIRRKGDRGVVLVMDRRLLTKGYGGTFVKSLPPVTVQRGPLAKLLAEGVAWLRATPTEV